MSTTYPDREHIARLLRPASVAVVGASDKPGALGASVLGNLLRNGFAGRIYPVNPNRETIGDLPCLLGRCPARGRGCGGAGHSPSLRSGHGARVGRAQGGRGNHLSAGFAEGGPEGLAQQAEIARIGRESGMVIEGPTALVWSTMWIMPR
jgi:acyl-CoA synthetase (NDP forming)